MQINKQDRKINKVHPCGYELRKADTQALSATYKLMCPSVKNLVDFPRK